MAKTYLDESRHGLGVLLILLSAFSFSCMSLFVAKSRGIHLFEQTFFRNLIDIRSIDICRRYLNPDARLQSLDDMDEEELPVFSCPETRLLSLRMDLALVMRRLTPEQRQVCQWIMDGLSLRAIARKLKISDSNFFFLYVCPIRDEFRKEKMEEYLKFY